MTREEKILAEIMDLVVQLGWDVLVPSEEGGPVNGIIIGNEEFIGQYSGEIDDESLH
jgi:hypothetical protein